MRDAEFNQLVENLKRDGVLTSAPLIYQGEVLSGNHRVQAAIAAGIDEADAIEILTPLTDQQKIAIQLSHNAISGEDDPNVLQRLYSGLDLSYKAYTGLTDDAFVLDEIDTAGLGIGQPKYQELTFLFLPEDEDVFNERLEVIAKAKKPTRRLAADYKDFNRIFDALVAVKRQLNIHNGAVALRLMAELAVERLDQLQGEAENQESVSSDGGARARS